jgi:PIN domain nuclease of toxin-antitoxin system
VARNPESQVIHLDTHIVCWLYEGRVDLLSPAAKAAVEIGRLLVSPLVELELQLLNEIGRIIAGPDTVLPALAREIGLQATTTEYRNVVTAARELKWTRDPFDRLIVADAMLSGARFVTRDRLIRRHCPVALW